MNLAAAECCPFENQTLTVASAYQWRGNTPTGPLFLPLVEAKAQVKVDFSPCGEGSVRTVLSGAGK